MTFPTPSCRLRTLVTLLLVLAAGLLPFTGRGAPAFELFALDNGVGRGTWTPAQQAGTLRELGYQGISYNYTNPSDLKAWLAELGKAQLRFYGLYVPARLQNVRTFPDGLEEALPLLRGTGGVLWLIIPAAPKPGDHEAEAIRKIQEAADLAARSGLRVVLYPHKGFYVATAEHALSLVLKAGRANVGLTVNLAHELAAGNGPRLPDILRRVAPCLALVTLNGATDRPAAAWDNYIKVLGDGEYDVPGLVRTLEEIRYTGPVGIQFYNLKGDARENLARTMAVWKSWPAAAPGR